MTALGTTSAASRGLERLAQRESARQARRARIDGLFARGRPVAEQARRGPDRLTLDDLEQMTQTELGQKLSAKPEDPRSGIVKFFDLLDLPRNVVANTVLRPFVDAKTVRGSEKGALGLPTVTFSDILAQMGAKPSFSRSALGFVGDVALDPLTYLTFGAGTGGKVALKAGELPVRRGAQKAISKTLGRISQGQGAGQIPERLGELAPIFQRLEKTAARMTTAGKSQAEIRTRLQNTLGVGGLTRRKPGKSGIRGLPAIDRPGIIGRTIGTDSNLGQAVTQFAQREILPRHGVSLTAPFTRGAARLELASFDPVVNELRGIDVAKLRREGGMRLRSLEQSQNIRRGLLGSLEATRVQELDFMQRQREAMDQARRSQLDLNIDNLGLGAGPAPGEELLDSITAEITRTQREIEQMTTNVANVTGTIQDLQFATAAKVNNRVVRVAAEIHSPEGLDWAMKPSILMRLSKVIRGTAPDPGGFRAGTANTLLRISNQQNRLFQSATRGTPIGNAIRQAQNAGTQASLEAAQRSNTLAKEIGRFSQLHNASVDQVSEVIMTKLELGMAAQNAPNGSPLFAGIRTSDKTVISTPGEIRELRNQANALGETMGVAPIWDEILDRTADGMEVNGGALWNEPSINQFVSDLQAEYGQLAELSIKGGWLERGIPNYAGRLPTEAARNAMRNTRATQGLRTGSAGEASIMSSYPIERHRTTNRFTWTDADGVTHDMYGFEVAALERQADAPRLASRRQIVPDAEMMASAGAARGRLAKLKEAIDQKQVPEYGFQTSAFHANEMAETGRFQSLLGGDYKDRMFSADPAASLAHVIEQVDKKKIANDLGQYMNRFGHPLDWTREVQPLVRNGKLERVGAAADEAAGAGNVYRVMGNISDAQGRPVANIGDVVRPLRLGADHPLVRNLDSQLGGQQWYHTDLADRIEEFGSYWEPGTSQADGLMRTLDKITSYWKTMTLAHPSWFMMNSVGHVMASAMAGVGVSQITEFPKAGKIYTRYNKLLKNNLLDAPEGAAFMNSTVRLGEQSHRVGDVIDTAVRSGVLEQGRMLREMVNSTLNTQGQLAGDVAASQNVLFKIPGVRRFFLFNHHTEQTHRLTTMMGRMSAGLDNGLDAAARNTIGFHYDYGDLTRFENSAMRRMFPFWTWMRNNTPFQVRKLMEDPRYAALFPKLQDAMDDAHASQSQLPKQLRPKWFNEQLGAQVADGLGLMLPLATPIGELAEVAQAVPGIGGSEDRRQFLHWMLSSTNPTFQIPAELATGREFFTGREIGDPDLGAISPGSFLASQIRPVREVARFTDIATRDDLTIGEKFNSAVSRGLLAGRIQRIDPERVAQHETFRIAQEIQQLRNTANREVRAGRQNEAIRIAVRIEALQREIQSIDPTSQRLPNVVRARLQAQQDGEQ